MTKPLGEEAVKLLPCPLCAKEAELDAARAAMRWVTQVRPSTRDGGAWVSMTWQEFNAMRAVCGLREMNPGEPIPPARAEINLKLRLALEAALHQRDALETTRQFLVDRLKVRNDQLSAASKALEFYATEANWSYWQGVNNLSHVSPAANDRGDIARQALSDLKEMGESDV